MYILTATPANIFNNTEKGKIASGKIADIVIAKKKSANLYDTFYNLQAKDILMIIKSGKVVYFDDRIYALIKQYVQINAFDKLSVEGTIKHIHFPLRELEKKIAVHYPKFEGLSLS